MTDQPSSDSIHAAVLAERRRMERTYAAQVRSFESQTCEGTASATTTAKVPDGPPPQGSGPVVAFCLELLRDPTTYVVAVLAVLWLVILVFPIVSLPPWQARKDLAEAVEKTGLLETQMTDLSQERERLATEKGELQKRLLVMTTTQSSEGWSEVAVELIGREARSNREFYEKLAKRLDDYRTAHFRSDAELVKDVSAGYRGCLNLRLWLAAHPDKLGPDDRRWLTDRCLAWAEQFDQDLLQIAESPSSSQTSIRKQTIARVDDISRVLKERAARG